MFNYNSKSKFSCRTENFLLLLFILQPLALYPQIKQNQIFINPVTEISEISTNTKGCDFAPDIVQDSLYFATYNQEQKIKGKETQFCKLYKVVIDKEGNTISKRYPVEPFITPFNEGPVSYCKKTGELYITANYTDQSVHSKKFTYKINRLRIIIAKQRGGKWVQVSEFPSLTIQQNRQFLMFSSKGRFGFGDYDIYYTRFPSDFSEISHFESPVNTEYADFADNQPVNPIKKNDPAVEKEPQLKRDAPVSIEPETKFYVILGSFQDINVATELAQNLSSQGNEPLIIQETLQFRVGIEYSDYKEATKAKERYHQLFKTAWVLIQKKLM